MSLLRLKHHWLFWSSPAVRELAFTEHLPIFRYYTRLYTKDPTKNDLFFLYLQVGKSMQSGDTDESGF